MRILLVASTEVDSVPEIRLMTQRHHVTVITGRSITAEEIYEECRRTHYDILHFATHGDDENIFLSETEKLSDQDIVQLCKSAGVVCVVNNACSTGRLASSVVWQGVKLSVYSNVDLDEEDAWRFVSSFYGSLSGSTVADILQAFGNAFRGYGVFGLAIDPHYLVALEDEVAQYRRRDPGQMILSSRLAFIFLVSFVLMIVLVGLSIYFLSTGGGG